MRKEGNDTAERVEALENDVSMLIYTFGKVHYKLPSAIKTSPETCDLLGQSTYYQMHSAPLSDTFMGLRIECDFDNHDGSVRICGM